MLKRALSVLTDIFPLNLLTEAKRLLATQAVLTVRLSDGLLRSRVLGPQHHIYNVYLDFKTWPNTTAQCGCAAKQGLCAHVAASILSLQEKNQITFELPKQDNYVTLPTAQEPPSPLEETQFEWYSQYGSDSDSFGFFSYEMGIVLDGEQINLIPFFIALLRQYEPSLLFRQSPDHPITITLDDGRPLTLPLKRIKPFIEYLSSLQTTQWSKKKKLSLSRYELLLMAGIEQTLEPSMQRSYGLTELKQGFLELLHFQDKKKEAKTPSTLFQGTLRPYQHTGIVWLETLRKVGFGGVLADDMGLGKTLQTLAFLAQEKEQGRVTQPSLVIAPTSVIGNWLAECRRFLPTLKVLLYHGQTRNESSFDDYDIIISTYGTIQKDKRQFSSYIFYYLILDEAQYIKNFRSKTTQVVHQIKSNHRLCLTGTPFENHLGELWSLFHFIIPGLLGDHKSFNKTYRVPIEKHQDKEKLTTLLKLIQPFILRRTKNEVLNDLPDKIEMIRWVSLSQAQRELYESIRVTTERTVRDAILLQGFLKSQIVLLDALLKLRQVCCDPRLLSFTAPETKTVPSAKLETCMELVHELIAEGRRILIFSQFTSMLSLIEKEFIQYKYPYLKLTGQTKNRQSLIQTFQSGTIPLFLISLKAGGTGLNLTAADTVIHFDPWWNPAVEHQATDRSHRIGQTRTVFVYRLITKGTVEEVMLGLQSRKKDLFSALMNEESLSSGHFHLSEQDLEALFNTML